VNDGEHAAEWRTTPLRASHRGGSAEITKAPGGWWWVVSTPYIMWICPLHPPILLLGLDDDSSRPSRAHTSGLEGVHAVKFGWSSRAGTCCIDILANTGLAPCIPGSCGVMTRDSLLPLNPFFATVVGGKCRCPLPQTANLRRVERASNCGRGTVRRSEPAISWSWADMIYSSYS
jgi:hypothetical protein